MNRILAISIFLTSFCLNAQDFITHNGFKEDFTSVSTNTNGTYSIFWWGKKSPVGTEENAECAGQQICMDFTHTTKRSGNGDLELTITQPENGFTPIGFGLQNSNNTSWVDISCNHKIEVSLTNEGGAGIEVYFTFISNGTTGVNAKLATATSTGSLYGGVISAGATMTKTFDVSAGRKHAWIDVNDPQKVTDCTNSGGTVAGSYCMQDKGFKSNALSGVEFSINGEGTSINGAWIQPAITAHPIKVHYIKGGQQPFSTCLVGMKRKNITDVAIFLNSASGLINISFNSNSIPIVDINDMAGKKVLFQQGKLGENKLGFSISSLKAGVYLVRIQSQKETYTEKLVVRK